MARKPGSMYHSIKQQPYTRREYMGGIPASRITQFILGNKKGSFPIKILLTSNESCQIRHTALESSRITANRTLEKRAGTNDYKLTIKAYPHHVLRENKQATGAGADRVSQGMRASFGKTVGIAAREKTNQVVMTVEAYNQNIIFTKESLKKASSKLPSPCTIRIAG